MSTEAISYGNVLSCYGNHCNVSMKTFIYFTLNVLWWAISQLWVDAVIIFDLCIHLSFTVITTRYSLIFINQFILDYIQYVDCSSVAVIYFYLFLSQTADQALWQYGLSSFQVSIRKNVLLNWYSSMKKMEKDFDDFCRRKSTLKVKFWQFLTSSH